MKIQLGLSELALERYRSTGEVHAVLADGDEIHLEGVIVAADDAWFAEILGIPCITASAVRDAMNAVEGPVTLVLNSPGGDVFEAAAIVDAMSQRDGGVNIRVAGLAASAAAGLTLFAKRVECSPMSLMMFHRAWTFAVGNSLELTETARLLAKVDGQFVDAMMARADVPQDEAEAILDGPKGGDGTWYTAQEAVDAGFADAISGGGDHGREKDEVADYAEMLAKMRVRHRMVYDRRQ